MSKELNIQIPVDHLESILRPMVLDAVKKALAAQKGEKPDSDKDNELLDRDAARKMLGGISYPTLWRLTIPKIKVAGRVFYRKSDIQNYIDQKAARYLRAHGMTI